MTIVELKWSPLAVPCAIDVFDRMPTQRDDGLDVSAMEVQLLWPRMWHMACRPED
jgi:hypothetical protein